MYLLNEDNYQIFTPEYRLDVIRQVRWEGVLDKLTRLGLIKLDRPYRAHPNGAIYILCFHHKERTPSFCLYPDGYCRCYGCKFETDISEFVAAHLRDGDSPPSKETMDAFFDDLRGEPRDLRLRYCTLEEYEYFVPFRMPSLS